MMISTNKFREGRNEISSRGGGGDNDVGSHDDFAPQNEREGRELERMFRAGTEDESSNQPAPSENICVDKRPSATVIVALAHHF
jgi:hypothetical protein